tara:strand:+ start:536 stop:808 length:273 start_codon:yes stop_codon:yes gene_type:complete
MKKSKGYNRGGKTKMGMAGGMKTKMGMAGGRKAKLPMVEKNGEMVPFFAADGKGKMMAGRMVPKTKGYFKGGKVMQSKMATKGGKRGGKG